MEEKGLKFSDSKGTFRSSEAVALEIVQQKTFRMKLLDAIECDLFHYIIIVLILFDLVILMVQQVLELHHLEGYLKSGKGLKIAHQALFIGSCFILALFVLEIILKIVLLGTAFLKNILNLLDALVILFSLPFEVYLHLYHHSIGQIAAPTLIIFRFWKVIRGIHSIAHSVEVKNQLIIQRIEGEKNTALNRINNYQLMIHELSNQLVEKEERTQEAIRDSQVLNKKIHRLTRKFNTMRMVNTIDSNTNQNQKNKLMQDNYPSNKEEDSSSNSSSKTIKLNSKESYYSIDSLQEKANEDDNENDENDIQQIYINPTLFDDCLISPKIGRLSLQDSKSNNLNNSRLRRSRGSISLSQELVNIKQNYFINRDNNNNNNNNNLNQQRQEIEKSNNSSDIGEKDKSNNNSLKSIKLTPSREKIYNLMKNGLNKEAEQVDFILNSKNNNNNNNTSIKSKPSPKRINELIRDNNSFNNSFNNNFNTSFNSNKTETPLTNNKSIYHHINTELPIIKVEMEELNQQIKNQLKEDNSNNSDNNNNNTDINDINNHTSSLSPLIQPISYNPPEVISVISEQKEIVPSINNNLKVPKIKRKGKGRRNLIKLKNKNKNKIIDEREGGHISSSYSSEFDPNEFKLPLAPALRKQSKLEMEENDNN